MIYTVGITSMMGIYVSRLTLESECQLSRNHVVLFTHVHAIDEEEAVHKAVVSLAAAYGNGTRGWMVITKDLVIHRRDSIHAYVLEAGTAIWNIAFRMAMRKCGSIRKAAALLNCDRKTLVHHIDRRILLACKEGRYDDAAWDGSFIQSSEEDFEE